MWGLIAAIIEWLFGLWLKKPQQRVKDSPLSDAEELSDFDRLP